MDARGTILERFNAKWIPEPNTGCWLWTGAGTGKFRYATIWDTKYKRNRRASQVSWELKHNQPFPAGMDACHKCDTPRCVNPDHIWPGTKSQNSLDASAKGRLKYNPQYAISRKAETHCKRGHEFSKENTKIQLKTGARNCRACNRMRYVKIRDARKAAEILETQTKEK